VSGPRELAKALSRDRERLAPLLGARRAWWLREALDSEAYAECPPLRGRAEADVVIVGGGFTGLWTAWQLVEQAPGIRVVLLEADIVGGGPSGRNGGFVGGWWDDLVALARSFGRDGAVACAEALGDVAATIGAWCTAHDVDAWHDPAGYLAVSTAPPQDGAWRATVEAARAAGQGDRFEELSAEQARRRSGSPVVRGGLLVRDGASVQPARLARGLRRILLERGVTIHEGTRVGRIAREAGRPLVLAERGAVASGQVVLALNAWAAGWPGFGSRLVTWSSYMVLTEPMPDRLAEIGYTGDEAITDARFTNHYWRPTRDGRIAFGGGGGRAGFGGRLGRWTTHDLGSALLAARGFRRIYPQLRDVALVDAWGGPIDIAPNHLPSFVSLPPGDVHAGHGYSGSGVGPAHLGGRILAALALGRRPEDEPLLRLPVVGHRARRFPPEPFRFMGARVIREAIVASEQAADEGRRAAWPVRALARLPRAMGYDLGPE
jgi:glycine/D-amino acid oxidase-like deaminating enzyme